MAFQKKRETLEKLFHTHEGRGSVNPAIIFDLMRQAMGRGRKKRGGKSHSINQRLHIFKHFWKKQERTGFSLGTGDDPASGFQFG